MELRGCPGCSGFSYTLKYKQSIIDFASWMEDNSYRGVVRYQDIQRLIEDGGGCKDSETRMIVPFMVKAGIIGKERCEWHGSRIYALDTSDLFTKSGKCFIQFLKIELKREEIGNEVAKRLVQDIYEKFAKIQFKYLFNSEDAIYRNMVRFLLEYNNINETEFFILSTVMQDDTIGNLSDLIDGYRRNEFDDEEIQITYNINAYSYTSKLLLQYNLFQKRGDNIILNPRHDGYFRDLFRDDNDMEGIVNG